jgi:hypothetical protein
VTPALASSTTLDTARLNQATREEALAQFDFLSYKGGRSPGVPHHRHLSKRHAANRVRVDESANALRIAVPPIGKATTS